MMMLANGALVMPGIFDDLFHSLCMAFIAMVLFPLGGYLAGSIPFGLLVARMKGVDIRKAGSGNIGATNVGRVLGKRWGYLCFFLDVMKGLIPVLGFGIYFGRDASLRGLQIIWLCVACAAIMGHVFNIWLGFKGGKGVATAFGVVLGVFPYFTYAGLAAFAVWIIVTLATRYVSVGSIVAAVAFVPLFAAFNLPLENVEKLAPLGMFAAAMACLIIIKHRGNIKRLLNGTENKIGKKKTSVL
jgi:glycerol-3-phosphate acyltransferase PlsY